MNTIARAQRLTSDVSEEMPATLVNAAKKLDGATPSATAYAAELFSAEALYLFTHVEKRYARLETSSLS